MIKFPRFTFIAGPPESGRSTLRALLQKQDPGLCPMGFLDAPRRALFATHYPHIVGTEELNLGDITVLRTNVPGTAISHRDWLGSFTAWLTTRLGPQILGDLAKREVEVLKDYWPRFLFEDLSTLDDLQPFVSAYGSSEILIIHLQRSASRGEVPASLFAPYLGRHIGLNNNSTPSAMIDRLTELCGSTPTLPIDALFIPPLR